MFAGIKFPYSFNLILIRSDQEQHLTPYNYILVVIIFLFQLTSKDTSSKGYQSEITEDATEVLDFFGSKCKQTGVTNKECKKQSTTRKKNHPSETPPVLNQEQQILTEKKKKSSKKKRKHSDNEHLNHGNYFGYNLKSYICIYLIQYRTYDRYGEYGRQVWYLC